VNVIIWCMLSAVCVTFCLTCYQPKPTQTSAPDANSRNPDQLLPHPQSQRSTTLPYLTYSGTLCVLLPCSPASVGPRALGRPRQREYKVWSPSLLHALTRQQPRSSLTHIAIDITNTFSLVSLCFGTVSQTTSGATVRYWTALRGL
jgi:hypothetical protein